MIRQKNKFWAFMFSLCPGCGQLYLGFSKRGLSLLLYFWGSIAISSETGLSFFIFLCIILWLFSFFDTMTLNHATPETFAQLEDQFLIPHDNSLSFLNKRNALRFLGIALVVGGVIVLWQNVALSLLIRIVPEYVYDFLTYITQAIWRVLICVVVIGFGIKLIRGKKEQLEIDDAQLLP